MSIHCMNRVWEHSNQKGSSLFLLIALADYADHNGFSWPGLQTLARKTRLSSRHVSRLVSGLQAAGELLVLPRPGRSHLYVVLTGTDARRLDAALQRAADRGAVVDGLLDATLDRSPNTGDSLSRACPPARSPATQDGLSSPTHDIAVSSPTHDILSGGEDKLSGGEDILSGTHDIAMSSDPSLSGIDPPVKEGWQKTLKALRGQMTRATFEHCLLGSRVLHVEDSVWTVQIYHPHALDWLEHRLAGIIRRTLDHYLPGIQVQFVPRGSAQTVPITPPDSGRAAAPPEPAPVAAHHPSSAVRRPSSPAHRPSSAVRRPSSPAHHPSSAVRHPSSPIHHSSSPLRPSPIVHHLRSVNPSHPPFSSPILHARPETLDTSKDHKPGARFGMRKLIGNMARMYPLMIAMGLMIVVLAFVIGYFNSQAAAAYYAGAKGLRETTLMAQRVSLASTGLWLPAFKFLGLGLILGGIVMALRVIIDSLRAAGAKVLSNLPAERRPQLPGPPWYGRLMPLVMMLGMAFLFTAITLALTVIIGTLRMQARHLVGFYRQASGQTEPAGSDALAGKPELVPGGVAAD